MAEISALLAVIYLSYRTTLVGDTEFSPGINSRFELFFDQRFPKVKVCFDGLSLSSNCASTNVGSDFIIFLQISSNPVH